MFESKKKPRITPQQQLSAKPVRRVDAKVESNSDGGGSVTVPMRRGKLTSWIVKIPTDATKTFELDRMGMLVWEMCDGKTSIQQIIRKLSRQYGLSLRESQVSTMEFLKMLTKKGLIGIAVPEA